MGHASAGQVIQGEALVLLEAHHLRQVSIDVDDHEVCAAQRVALDVRQGGVEHHLQLVLHVAHRQLPLEQLVFAETSVSRAACVSAHALFDQQAKPCMASVRGHAAGPHAHVVVQVTVQSEVDGVSRAVRGAQVDDLRLIAGLEDHLHLVQDVAELLALGLGQRSRRCLAVVYKGLSSGRLSLGL